MEENIIYALDFDGVICDSAVETAITGWKAARFIWDDMPPTVPAECIDHFREIRPIIETGYEAILAMRLLYLGHNGADIYQHYGAFTQDLLREVEGGVDRLKMLFGTTRDQWIAEDLPDWVAMNPLFPGVAEKLRRIQAHHLCYIITTKQERFVKQILKAQDLAIPDGRIFGLDRNFSKPEVLRQLLRAHPGQVIVFVEDRLPTLENVLNCPDLAGIHLVFARWGYNTEADKAKAGRLPIVLQSLDEFLVQ